MTEKELERREKIRNSLKLSFNEIKKTLENLKEIKISDKIDLKDWYENNYKNAHSKIELVCFNHEPPFYFERKINNIRSGQISCPLCSKNKNHQKSVESKKLNNFKKYQKRIEEYCLKNNYKTNFNLKWYLENYKNTSVSNIEFICEKNHKFYKSIINISKNSKCPYCQKKDKWTREKFLNTIREKKFDLIYDYSLITEKWWQENYKNVKTKIPIICKNCKRTYYISLLNHIHNNQGCKFCTMSKGEEKLSQILKKLNLDFKQEYYLPESKLRLDFYIPKYNLAIEFDGPQHFSNKYNHHNITLKKIKKNDFLKNRLCHIYKINLIRIPYWEYENLEEYLIKILKKFKFKRKVL